MNRPIFILGTHKSGTSLLRSLLDHNGADNDLFVVPIEGHFFEYGGFGVSYDLRYAPVETLSFSQLTARFCEHVRQTNHKDPVQTRTSDSVLTGRLNEPGFEKVFTELARSPFDAADWRGVMEAYVNALYYALYGKVMDAERFVEKSVENAEHVPYLAKLFPDATFLHIVRNPYATLVAVRRHFGRKRFPYLGGIAESLRNGYDALYKNQRLVTDYRVIRYEDLVRDVSGVMKQICEACDLAFTSNSLRPTLLGQPWGGNSTSGRSFDTVSRKPLKAWRSSITSLEVTLVNLLFPHILYDYDYAREQPSGSTVWPVRGEGPAAYIGNRVYLRYAWLRTMRSP